MDPKLLLLGKDHLRLEDLAKRLESFTKNIVTETEENKISELLNNGAVNIIILDNNISEEEQSMHEDHILSLNKTIPFHLISKNKITAFDELTSFLKSSLRAYNEQPIVEKLTSIQQTQTQLIYTNHLQHTTININTHKSKQCAIVCIFVYVFV